MYGPADSQLFFASTERLTNSGRVSLYQAMTGSPGRGRPVLKALGELVRGHRSTGLAATGRSASHVLHMHRIAG